MVGGCTWSMAYRAQVPPRATTSNAALSGKKNFAGAFTTQKMKNFTLQIVPPPLPPPFGLCRPKFSTAFILEVYPNESL